VVLVCGLLLLVNAAVGRRHITKNEIRVRVLLEQLEVETMLEEEEIRGEPPCVGNDGCNNPFNADLLIEPDRQRIGEALIDGHVRTLLSYFSSFEVDDSGKHLFDEDKLRYFLTLLNVADAEILGELKGLAEFDTIEDFVNQIASCVKKNPMLVSFAVAVEEKINEEPTPLKQAAMRKRLSLIPDDENVGVTIQDAVHYTLVLHAMTKAIAVEPAQDRTPTLIKRIHDLLLAKRALNPGWGDYMNTFEKAKIYSIDKPFAGFVNNKGLVRDARVNSTYEWVTRFINGVSANIFEAMCQDILEGHDSNADAGFEMMVHPPGLEALPGLGNAPSRAEEGTGNLRAQPPLPLEWDHLYSAWNLAFVSNYKESPFFFAKLLAPCVSCDYLGDATVYLYNRIIALYLHINREIFARCERRSREPAINWRNEELTELFGTHNLKFANVFAYTLETRFYNAIGQSWVSKAGVKFRARVVTNAGVWQAARGLVKTFKLTGKAADAFGDFFQELKETVEFMGG
jgi:hypothetical protein